jgi:DNA/RNA-binding domain of Phe-tRNA-synthetase-like protein
VSDPALHRGRVEAAIAQEFPTLAVVWTLVPGAAGRVGEGVRERLATMASRIDGAQAVALRHGEVPHAHRVFFRHVGIDPDVVRTPVEQAMVDRLVDGGFPARDRVQAACLIALVETGVAVWAVDGATRRGDLALRAARAGERLGAGEHADELPAGRLVLADDAGPMAVLFGPWDAGRRPTTATAEVCLVAVRVPGVSDLHVEEALWTAADALGDG